MGTASRATTWRQESSRAWSFGGFLKTGQLPLFRGPIKIANRIFTDMAASRRRLRVEEKNSAVEWDHVNISGLAPTGILDYSLNLGVFWTLCGHLKYPPSPFLLSVRLNRTCRPLPGTTSPSPVGVSHSLLPPSLLKD